MHIARLVPQIKANYVQLQKEAQLGLDTLLTHLTAQMRN
jgi:hypothetical protein